MEYKREEHNDMIPQTDAYGNPIRTPVSQGYGGVSAGEEKHHQSAGITGILHRSGSSSSSSSEDDGMGGRRKKKKALKEKIKEKLPGAHKSEEQKARQDGEYEHEHEKKGFMEKIKEKLPGTHKDY
ncbi:dehydrin Xero 1-like [Zingiber officinale]|uniref:Dehydrin n=1 Tax=Zingiber officinale TaxID=94328 RepID=A0A8J5F826_ZINOF|nr:dehydrin Xero 1-like [Zingiber officinale]KAG6481198.1 hypothetical protein ZIOFF_057794 [Zingiber officinale]